jgi:hypothetical protein
MQVWLTNELSGVCEDAVEFFERYGENFDLVIRISAQNQITGNLLKGPTIFEEEEDVEYTLFLPYDVIIQSADGRRAAATFLLEGIRAVFERVGIRTARLNERTELLLERLCSDPAMLKGPWPSTGGGG